MEVSTSAGRGREAASSKRTSSISTLPSSRKASRSSQGPAGHREVTELLAEGPHRALAAGLQGLELLDPLAQLAGHVALGLAEALLGKSQQVGHAAVGTRVRGAVEQRR